MQSPSLLTSKRALNTLTNLTLEKFGNLSLNFSINLLKTELIEFHQSFEYVRATMLPEDIESLKLYFQIQLNFLFAQVVNGKQKNDPVLTNFFQNAFISTENKFEDNQAFQDLLSIFSPKENSKIENNNNANTNIMHSEEIEIENNTNIIQPNKIEPSTKTYRFNIKDNGCDLPCKDIVLSIPEKSKFTIGDGHGSMLAVFRRLYMAGFFSNISQENYQALKKLYNLPKDEITREKMLEFLQILRVSWDDKFDQRLVETIGDLFGDRGKNDIWTILLLGFLAEKIQIWHLMGNHDFEIIPTFFEQNKNACLQFSRQGMDSPTVNSANNLFSWLETVTFKSNSGKISNNQSNTIGLTKIETVVQQAEAPTEIIDYFWDKIYSTSLKLLSVEQTTDGGITISTHAPNDHAIVFSLAAYLKIEKIEKIKTNLIP